MKPLFEKKSEKIALADLPKAGDMVVSVSKKNLKQGDVVAFYYNNKVLVKRVIATSGQWINIDKKGNVFVDGKKINEPYLKSGKKKLWRNQYRVTLSSTRWKVLCDRRPP